MTQGVLTGLLRNDKQRKREIGAIDAREIIPAVARYTTNAGQSLATATTTLINFEDADYDPRSLVTVGAAWAFTAPVGGYYQVSAKVALVGTNAWSDGELLALDVYINGAYHSRLFASQSLGSGGSIISVSAQGSTIAHLNRGDALSIRVTQGSGIALTLSANSTENHISIGRITP